VPLRIVEQHQGTAALDLTSPADQTTWETVIAIDRLAVAIYIVVVGLVSDLAPWDLRLPQLHRPARERIGE
jgi:hypothetical protein